MAEETIPQMRERIETLEKQVKTLESVKTDLGKENRTLKARELARDQGYDPTHGELFAASSDGDITADGLSEFAGRYGLTPTQSGSADSAPAEAEKSVEDDAGSLESMSRAGSSAGSPAAAGPGADMMTRQEYNDLAKSNPAAAKEAVAAGRVTLRADNPWTR